MDSAFVYLFALGERRDTDHPAHPRLLVEWCSAYCVCNFGVLPGGAVRLVRPVCVLPGRGPGAGLLWAWFILYSVMSWHALSCHVIMPYHVMHIVLSVI